jgi:hypothetical protein
MRNIKRLLKRIHTELELLALALREIKHIKKKVYL